MLDDTRHMLPIDFPSLNTTKRLIAELDKHDFVMHIGDIAYAEGFGATVSA